jgi:hypothetical protein
MYKVTAHSPASGASSCSTNGPRTTTSFASHYSQTWSIACSALSTARWRLRKKRNRGRASSVSSRSRRAPRGRQITIKLHPPPTSLILPRTLSILAPRPHSSRSTQFQNTAHRHAPSVLAPRSYSTRSTPTQRIAHRYAPLSPTPNNPACQFTPPFQPDHIRNTHRYIHVKEASLGSQNKHTGRHSSVDTPLPTTRIQRMTHVVSHPCNIANIRTDRSTSASIIIHTTQESIIIHTTQMHIQEAYSNISGTCSRITTIDQELTYPPIYSRILMGK